MLEADEPYVSIDRELDGSIHMLGGRIDLKGSIEDESEIDRLMLVVDGKQEKDITGSLLESGDFNYGLDSSGLAEGTHSIWIYAVDSVGNTGNDQVSIILDGTDPTLTIEPIDTFYPLDGEILVQGRASDDIKIAKLWTIYDEKLSLDITDKIGRSGAFEIDLLQYYSPEEGDHEVRFELVDTAKNRMMITLDYTVDNTAPVLSLNQLPEIVLEGEILQIVGTIDELYPISSGELTIQYMVLDIVEMVAEDTVIYTLDTGDLQVGTVEVILSVEDHVGNRAQASTSFTLVDRRTDSDDDGIPDWWEFMYEGMDPYTADSDRDMDNDGFTNLEEYLGSDGVGGNDDYTDPTNSVSAPTSSLEQDEGNIYLPLLAIITISFIAVAAISFLVIRRRKID